MDYFLCFHIKIYTCSVNIISLSYITIHYYITEHYIISPSKHVFNLHHIKQTEYKLLMRLMVLRITVHVLQCDGAY